MGHPPTHPPYLSFTITLFHSLHHQKHETEYLFAMLWLVIKKHEEGKKGGLPECRSITTMFWGFSFFLRLGVSVETGRSRDQSPNLRACRLSPLLLLLSFSTMGCLCSFSLCLSPPSSGVVAVCLVFSSYRLHRLPPLAPAAPRLLHRLQRCCSSSSSSSITRAASPVLSASLGGDWVHSTFFSVSFAIPPTAGAREWSAATEANNFIIGAPHWWVGRRRRTGSATGGEVRC